MAGVAVTFGERDYLRWDPFEGERDTGISRQSVRIVCARKLLPCALAQDGHQIERGTRYRSERALIDRKRWVHAGVCLACMDAWLTDLGVEPVSSPQPPADGGATGV